MVKGRLIALLSAALLVVGLLAGPGLATFANTDSDGSSSEAEISLVDCVVESSKDISYVAFLDGGEELDKFNVNQPTYDLTTYENFDDLDSVRVKSGETVESFGVSDCDEDTDTDGDDTTDDDTTDDHDDDTTGDDDDDTTGDDDDDTTGDDDDEADEDDDVTQPDSVESHNDKANTNSAATITLSGCTLNSSKDISYIAFLSDGSQVDKIEGVDADSYDLDGYDGIEDVDQVRVKAGTTVATFAVSCGTANTDGDTDDDAKDDDTKTDDHDDDTTWDDHDDDEAKDDDDAWDDHDDDAVKDDSDDTSGEDDDTDEDSDDTAETDEEWDARHDGRHEHKDHEEIEHEDS